MRSDPPDRARGSDGSGPGDPARPLDDDTAFRLLGNGRRRAVVRHLAAASRPVRLTALVDAVAATEADDASLAGAAGRGDRARKRVSVALRQAHLPKLADAGVIRYDRRADVVVPTPVLDVLADRLARSTDDRAGTGRAASGGGRSLPVRAAVALVSAVTTLLVSARFVAALSAATPALVASVVVALAVFGTLTLTDGADGPPRD